MDASNSSTNSNNKPEVPDASKQATKKPFDPTAFAFVPKTPQAFVQFSTRFHGNRGHFESIKQHFESLTWPATVRTVYVTNGWHTGYGNYGPMIYCGYCVNEDSEFGKQHYNLDPSLYPQLANAVQKLGLV